MSRWALSSRAARGPPRGSTQLVAGIPRERTRVLAVGEAWRTAYSKPKSAAPESSAGLSSRSTYTLFLASPGPKTTAHVHAAASGASASAGRGSHEVGDRSMLCLAGFQ